MVVVLVAILSALAVPALSKSRNDQLAFDFARRTQLLFNRARTRANTGYAQLLTADLSGRGKFWLFEAVDDQSCARKDLWKDVRDWDGNAAFSSTTARAVEAVNVNAATNSIVTTEDIKVADNAGRAALAYCVMPNGRVFFGAGADVKAAVDAMQGQGDYTWTGQLDLRVTTASGATRSVLVGGGSSARVLSR